MVDGDFDWFSKQDLDKYCGFWVVVYKKKVIRLGHSVAIVVDGLRKLGLDKKNCLVVHVGGTPRFLRGLNGENSYHLNIKL